MAVTIANPAKKIGGRPRNSRINEQQEPVGCASTPQNRTSVQNDVSVPDQFLEGITNVTTLARLLRHCGKAKALSYGRRVHAIIRGRFNRNVFLGNCLIQMYGDCGSTDDARDVFDNMANLDIYSWNMLMTAYAKNGMVDSAKSIFGGMPERDMISWNVMIAACAQNGYDKEALEFFNRLQLDEFEPDQFAFVSALDACANLAALEEGQDIHAAIVESGYEEEVIVGTAIVHMYGKSENLAKAKRVFDRMPQRDVAAWNCMIALCAENGDGKEALTVFHQMQIDCIHPDQITFLCLVGACANLAALVEGKEVHATIVDSGCEKELAVGTALISMYGKCGCLYEARIVFSGMPQRNEVSWNAMIAACAQNGCGKEALDVFHHMQLESIEPDQMTFVSALDACAILAALEEGKEIHATVVQSGNEGDLFVGNAILNMYGKCGKLQNARRIFGKIPRRDMVSWNAMIAACAQNGHGKEALDLFDQMNVSGFKPSSVTFLSVLTACSHTGHIYEGMRLFLSMTHEYCIQHTVDHYACMIDLFGRAGHMDEAEDLIHTMPFVSNPSVWSSLLGACRIHGDVTRGSCAARQLCKLDPKTAAPYLLLFNIYAVSGQWESFESSAKELP